MNTVIQYLAGLLMTLPVVLLSLSVHELSHGAASYLLGDVTAKSQGRLSLNPLRHIDPIGLVALFVFHFGWAKPVTVDPRYLKKPKRDMALIALAGPVSNFLTAFLFSFVYGFLIKIGSMHDAFSAGVTPFTVLCEMAQMMVLMNIGLGLFNLIPIPPLDGSKILYAFLPNRILFRILPYERYMQIVLIVLLFLRVVSVPLNAGSEFLYRVFMTLPAKVFF